MFISVLTLYLSLPSAQLSSTYVRNKKPHKAEKKLVFNIKV